MPSCLSPRHRSIPGRSLAGRLLVVGLFACGCASVSVHGVVDETDGRPIENARITLQLPGAGPPGITAVTSDPKGCFFLYETVRPEGRVYDLVIESPGHKSLSVVVPSRQPNLLHVTLAAETGADPSKATPIAPSDRPLLYEVRCEPAVRASNISLR
jgi:hypothetical protein